MAICPFAVQQIIPESHTQGEITPTTLIYHRAVSSAESLYAYWNSPGVELESHFYIGQHGVIYQFMDTEIRADANVDANGFAISVETWDGGNTPDDMPWNPEQLAAAKRLAAWVCETHGIKRAAAQAWNGGGIGGHNWFPIPWADGPRGCPGTARNAQIRNDIVPYVAAGGGWRNVEEDDMPYTEDQLKRIVREAFLDAPIRQSWDPDEVPQSTDPVPHSWIIASANGKRATVKRDVKAIASAVASVATTLAGVVSTLTSLVERVARLEKSGVPMTVDYSRIAAETADLIDRRARDGDPKTGPTS